MKQTTTKDRLLLIPGRLLSIGCRRRRRLLSPQHILHPPRALKRLLKATLERRCTELSQPRYLRNRKTFHQMKWRRAPQA